MTTIANCVNCSMQIYLDDDNRWRHIVGRKDIGCSIEPKATPENGSIRDI